MGELFNTLMVCAVLASLFPLIKSSKSFYDEWNEMENEHWRSRGAPPFVVFHFGMFLFGKCSPSTIDIKTVTSST